jgi:hypothetical protein
MIVVKYISTFSCFRPYPVALGFFKEACWERKQPTFVAHCALVVALPVLFIEIL